MKRHIAKTGKVEATIKTFADYENKRTKVKFTDAGFPIHDYLKEMRDSRERIEFKRASKVKVEMSDTAKHTHLSPPPAKRNILKSLQDELRQQH